MIRTTYRTPPITQFRLRLELATRRTRRAIEERRRAIRADTAAKQAAHGDYLRVRWQAELARERTVFEEFFDRYDDLIGLVCLAAQEGVEAWQEDKFGERRAWFLVHYGRVQRYVLPHVPCGGSNHTVAKSSTITPWKRGKNEPDIFETLFLPASLDSLLNGDNGDLIGVLTQAQEALSGWERDLTRREKAAA